MAPKKAVEAAPPPPPPPADPVVVEQQQKLDKWQTRISDVGNKHGQYQTQLTTAQDAKTQFDNELASLLERATELATMRVFGITPPSAQPAPAAVAAAAGGKPLAAKGKGGKVEPPPPPPPPEVPLTEEELRKRNKITNFLLSLYKRKRDPGFIPGSPVVSSPTTQTEAPPSPSAASVSGDVPNRPTDVPEDTYVTMSALREDRLATEVKLAAAVQAIKVIQSKLSSVNRMEHVAAYALQGSNYQLRAAVTAVEERTAKEQLAAKEAAAAAALAASPSTAVAPAAATPSPPKGKK
jgi:hypothetical protein